MAKPYKIWIRGTNTYFDADTNSEVTTGVSDSAPTVIAEPSGANGWLELECLGFNAEDIDEGETYQNPAGSAFDDPRMREQFSVQLIDLGMIADSATITALKTHLRKRYLFIATSQYDLTLHTVGKCIAVTRSWSYAHESQKGSKAIVLTFKKRELTV